MTDDNEDLIEQGFNDAELEDIMTEIENLEQDFQDDDLVESVSTEDPIAKEMEESGVESEEVSALDENSDLSKALGIEEQQAYSQDDLIVDKVEIPKTDIQKSIDSELDEILTNNSVDLDDEHEDGIINIEDISQKNENIQESKVVSIIEKKVETAKDESSNGYDTQMDFSVSGKMNLKLNFKIGGHQVQLHVNEKDGFIIEMEGGAQFSLPMKKAS